jgi:hypothetical protein
MELVNSVVAVEPVGLDGLSTPDAILPSQFFGLVGAPRFSSEQRLMLAVLIDAINLVLRKNCDRSHDFKEASSWIFASGIASPLSFDIACDAIGLNPEYLRKRLFELVAQRGSLRRLRIR